MIEDFILLSVHLPDYLKNLIIEHASKLFPFFALGEILTLTTPYGIVVTVQAVKT